MKTKTWKLPLWERVLPYAPYAMIGMVCLGIYGLGWWMGQSSTGEDFIDTGIIPIVPQPDSTPTPWQIEAQVRQMKGPVPTKNFRPENAAAAYKLLLIFRHFDTALTPRSNKNSAMDYPLALMGNQSAFDELFPLVPPGKFKDLAWMAAQNYTQRKLKDGKWGSPLEGRKYHQAAEKEFQTLTDTSPSPAPTLAPTVVSTPPAAGNGEEIED